MKTSQKDAPTSRAQQLDNQLAKMNAICVLSFRPEKTGNNGKTIVELFSANGKQFILFTMYDKKNELTNFDFFFSPINTASIAETFAKVEEIINATK
jgi:hypothetical protein